MTCVPEGANEGDLFPRATSSASQAAGRPRYTWSGSDGWLHGSGRFGRTLTAGPGRFGDDDEVRVGGGIGQVADAEKTAVRGLRVGWTEVGEVGHQIIVWSEALGSGLTMDHEDHAGGEDIVGHDPAVRIVAGLVRS